MLVKSVDNRRKIHHWSDDQPSRRRGDEVQSPRQGHGFHNDDAPAGSTFPPLRFTPSRNSTPAPVTVRSYISKYQLLLNERRLDSMHRDAAKLDFISPLFSARHDTILEAWKEPWKVFGYNGATFSGSIHAALDLLYNRHLEKCEYVVRLSSVVVTVRKSTIFSDRHEVCTVLDGL